ncbi:2-hydroxycarboxylate transporter family protein [Bradyrhizobium sp. U87765 SZCCT0131]|uniref:2-hydroxycarboxylate transporter family protein n=1 Tax=unclassified Bradyrhizobium TaxID=2631580 RepID=UPI001BA68563|nr:MULTISPECIES: 2-hydroxycarboxylate transporter family protein [unclassified Bradyrhizobium]MBR1217693.1 2-hydroxycarboxylate transporter family protein [Bradyrhizobium sp. U87765 SZCCT0131]MBR1261361.1 2-hydroxycarboxylate transporter family protein [Bradyrhizobium sp. U87765 SZCCT0134]MBR1303191.1 2-hydroxycarboxylate transporter family protein [Bradyrhizobium sp. U87765 SZCCT0110]MBR1318797.1 2-hydroxycarboxylate transporter family protein [Bradyrhizobium sp. U87765 SZCCT0109]MBR1347122.1
MSAQDLGAVQTTSGALSSAIQPGERRDGDTPRFWPEGWWRLIDWRIGIIPFPIYLLLFVLIATLVVTGEIKSDGPTMIAALVLGGFTCAEIGKRLPVLRAIGAGAIFATFIPSALAYYNLLPVKMVSSITEFTKATNFLYIFIASIIVGSIFAMDRDVLIKGFLKIFVPLAIGSVVAGLVGTVVGTLLGLGAHHTFFYVVVPIMAGGVGEGAIPLSIGYAALTGVPQGEVFAQVLPPVMLGSLTAILLSGALNFVGKKYPHLTGEGRLQPLKEGEADLQAGGHGEDSSAAGVVSVNVIAAAALTAITLYLLGVICHHLVGLPAPVAMLFLAVLAKLTRAVSPQLQQGGLVVFDFVRSTMTYPLLFAIGVALTPWDKLMAAFHIANIITIVATVATLMATGFVVGRFMNMYPIETAIVNACHSGQGGTGDVAILTAANRMQLMPFAQIATRIGGAITITTVLIVLGYLK